MRLSDIDLRLLRVFQAVALAGGFAKAQATLGISQPAISTQIGKLEDRLGVRLCDRGPGGFALTDAGRKVLEETNGILGQLDAAATRLNAIASQTNLPVRIGVVDSTVTDTNNPVVEILRQTWKTRPDLKIEIGIYDFLECLEELQADRLDICIVGIAGDEQIPIMVEAALLYQEESSLYCSPEHPCAKSTTKDDLRIALSEAQISAHSFVFNPIDRSLNPSLLDQSGGVAQDTIELTAYLALSGSHVGLLPDHYAAIWTDKGQLVRLDATDYSVTSDFHALRRQGKAHGAGADLVWQRLVSFDQKSAQV